MTHKAYFPKNLDDYAPWVAQHGLCAPYGECQCNCGQQAPIAQETRSSGGVVRHEPIRFIHNHHHNVGPSLKERFWQKVDVRKPNECWEWQGAHNGRGYGRIKGDGKDAIYAHRACYEFHYGPLPAGYYVCHHCDNPSCVNPNHLFAGTPSDNVQDMLQKDRHARQGAINPARGEEHSHSKLTDKTVRAMRKIRQSTGLSYKEIGERFSVTAMTAYRAITGQSWSHI